MRQPTLSQKVCPSPLHFRFCKNIVILMFHSVCFLVIIYYIPSLCYLHRALPQSIIANSSLDQSLYWCVLHKKAYHYHCSVV